MTDYIYDIFDYKEIKTCEEVKKKKREDAVYKVITKKEK